MPRRFTISLTAGLVQASVTPCRSTATVSYPTWPVARISGVSRAGWSTNSQVPGESASSTRAKLATFSADVTGFPSQPTHFTPEASGSMSSRYSAASRFTSAATSGPSAWNPMWSERWLSCGTSRRVSSICARSSRSISSSFQGCSLSARSFP